MVDNPQDTYRADMVDEVPDSQALSNYLPRSISDEIRFTDEIITVLLPMNAERFTKIVSSLATGAWWSFPGEWLEIMAWFWQAMREATIVDCEDVADCVESELSTNEDLINQITVTINNNGFGNPNRINGSLTKIQDKQPLNFNDSDVAPMPTCNLDTLWGGIRHGIVDRLDENLQDLLQDIAVIPTIIGRNAAWLDIIPVLGDIAEATVTTLSDVVPTLLTLFESYSSEASKDELACELFDMVCSECRYPTHKEVYDHFQSYGMASTPSITDWTLQVMTDLLTNPVGVASKVAYFTLMVWQLGIIYLGAKVNNASENDQLLRWAGLGEDFATNNWQSLCDGCDESYAYKVFDFKALQYGSSKALGYTGSVGTYVAGSGWRVDKTAADAGRLTVALPFNPAWKIRAFGWKTNQNRSIFGAGIDPKARTIVGSNTGASSFSMGVGYNNHYDCKDGLASITNFQEFALSLIINSGYQVTYLEKMIFVFDRGFAPSDAIPTSDATVCDWQY